MISIWSISAAQTFLHFRRKGGFSIEREPIKATEYGDRIEPVADGVYHIDDAHAQSFYLIEGGERALVIDTGMEARALIPLLRTLTEKPFVLALTHAHPDHMYHADEFETVCLGRADIAAWKGTLRLVTDVLVGMRKLPKKKFPVETYVPVTGRTKIDLGGNVIEALEAPGHTPGSMMYVDHQHRCIFTGDAVGSGMFVLMALPGCLKLSDYRDSLARLLKKLEPIADYRMYGGHLSQERGAGERGEDYYNPVTIEVVRDLYTLCDKLLKKELLPQGKGFLSAKYGKAEIQLRRDQLR